MIATSSDVEIFSLLEKAGRARFDMTKYLSFDFDHEGVFYFFIFCPGQAFRGTFLFSFPLSEFQFQLRHELILHLMELPETGEMAALKNHVLERAEELLSSRKMDADFFDAH